jgi:hypothetical protein
MLEILILMRFVRRLSAIAKEKGRSGGWGGLGALFWFGGEILGFAIGFAATDDLGGGAYVIALLCAALGAGAAYAIVKNLKPLDGRDTIPPASNDAVVATGEPVDLANPYAPPRAR